MKPYGRKTKKLVFQILDQEQRSKALKRLEEIPDDQLVGHLFSHFYHMDERIKFRSVTAMGELALRLAAASMEKARRVLRRIMWNLNDESGGIGWGSPEAMGEILNRSPELAMEFNTILFSYLDHRGNHIEHEMLQRGVLWGIGTYLEVAPDTLPQETRTQLWAFLESPDPVKRAYALRALIHAGAFFCDQVPDAIARDSHCIDIYTGWHLIPTRISDMAHACSWARA